MHFISTVSWCCTSLREPQAYPDSPRCLRVLGGRATNTEHYYPLCKVQLRVQWLLCGPTCCIKYRIITDVWTSNKGL